MPRQILDNSMISTPPTDTNADPLYAGSSPKSKTVIALNPQQQPSALEFKRWSKATPSINSKKPSGFHNLVSAFSNTIEFLPPRSTSNIYAPRSMPMITLQLHSNGPVS